MDFPRETLRMCLLYFKCYILFKRIKALIFSYVLIAVLCALDGGDPHVKDSMTKASVFLLRPCICVPDVLRRAGSCPGRGKRLPPGLPGWRLAAGAGGRPGSTRDPEGTGAHSGSSNSRDTGPWQMLPL